MEDGVLRRNEIGCYVAALNRVMTACGTLDHLPEGVMHLAGGLLPETARELEELMRELEKRGEGPLTAGRVMAAVDERLSA